MHNYQRGTLSTFSKVFTLLIILFVLGSASITESLARQGAVYLEAPPYFMSGNELTLNALAETPEGKHDRTCHDLLTIYINNRPYPLKMESGRAQLILPDPGQGSFTYHTGPNTAPRKWHSKRIPHWLSILPPLIAIAAALVFREVLLSLFLGILTGTLLSHPISLSGLLKALYAVFNDHVVPALTSREHMVILLFSTLIGGMVTLVAQAGGMAGLVQQIGRRAKGPFSAQWMTYLTGLALFFDDYTNTLVVGNTLRAITDRFGVSREKLAYLVDSTAAPITSIAFVTTWIGAQVAYLQEASAGIPLPGGPYLLFLNSLRYAYYPLFTLGFVALLLALKRDYGPMLKAEKLARLQAPTNAHNPVKRQPRSKKTPGSKAYLAKPGIPKRWHVAALPLALLVGTSITSLLYTGLQAAHTQLHLHLLHLPPLRVVAVWEQLPQLTPEGKANIIGKIGLLLGMADAYTALLWASVVSLFAALVYVLSQKLLSLKEALRATADGFGIMLSAMLVLVLAWGLSSTTTALDTANFLTGMLQGHFPPALFPMLTFVLAAAISFATGTSWGTMAILYPLVLPAGYAMAPESPEMLQQLAAVVLAGAIFGDHASPISDTTVLSALSSGCNTLDHLRTQLPYALHVGGVSLLALLAVAAGLPWWLALALGFTMLYLSLKLLAPKSP